MKWPKSKAVLLFSLCPFATCCSQNGWAQVGQETPGKITNAPLCLVCGTSSKWSTAPFNWLQSLQSLPLCTPWTCSGAWVQGGQGALGKARGRCYWKMNSLQIGRNIFVFIFAPLGICSHVGFLKENVTHSDFWWLWFNLFSLLGPALQTSFSLTDIKITLKDASTSRNNICLSLAGLRHASMLTFIRKWYNLSIGIDWGLHLCSGWFCDPDQTMWPVQRGLLIICTALKNCGNLAAFESSGSIAQPSRHLIETLMIQHAASLQPCGPLELQGKMKTEN